MIINGLPARFKLLPIVVIAFLLLASYFYFFDGNAIDAYYQNHIASSDSSAAAPAAPANEEDKVTSTPFEAGGGQHAAVEDPPAHDTPVTDGTQQSTAYSDTTDVEESNSKGGSSSLSSSSHSSDSKTSHGKTSGSSHPDTDSLSSPSDAGDDDDEESSSGPFDISGASVKKGSVVMVTASHGTKGFQGIPNIKSMVYENRMAYADKHGYDFMWADITSYNISEETPLYWNKIPVLREAFQRFPHAEWVWWMDLDIIIMNSSVSMWDHVLSPEAMDRQVVLGEMLKQPGGADSGWRTPESYEYDDVFFMISSGGWGMNVGNFLLRRSAWSDWLLNIWIDPLYVQQNWTFPENDAWTHMYRSFPIVRAHTVCTNQRALNAYPSYNSLGKHWEPGDHTVHFAGCGAHPSCPDRWNEYWVQREKLDVPKFIMQQLEDGTAWIENTRKGEDLSV